MYIRIWTAGYYREVAVERVPLNLNCWILLQCFFRILSFNGPRYRASHSI